MIRRHARSLGLKTALLIVFVGVLGCGQGAQPPAPADPPFAFEDLGVPEVLSDAFGFTEGPTWSRDEGLLYFSDLDFNEVYTWTPQLGFATEISPSRSINGMAIDREGRLLLAQQAESRILRRELDGSLTVLADRYGGQRLNSPNDIAVRSDGLIYFTDPQFGFAVPEMDFQGIYRLLPDGSLFLESEDSGSPNGIALSLDESLLYVALTLGGRVDVYDVAADGALSNRREFATALIADGLCLDAQGNVYVTSFEGLKVFSPDGLELGALLLDAPPANCGFGGADGKTIFVTARNFLYSIDAPVRGAAFAD